MVKLKFFAMLKGLVGKEEMELAAPDPTTLGELKTIITKEYPALTDLIVKRKVLISVNQEFADDNTVVRDGDEVAFLPPFSGG